MTHAFRKRWLTFTAILVMCFGPVFLLATHLPSAEPARFSMDILGWTFDGAQSFDHRTTRFLSALTGGFLVGWGITIWMLKGAVHDVAPRDVERAVVAGFTGWFMIDSIGSVVSGHPSNVGFNLVLLVVGPGPLWLPSSPRVAG